MPKYYELILHNDGEANSYPSEADEKAYEHLKVPDSTRPSSMDALVLRQVHMFWSREKQMGRTPKLEDDLEKLFYMQKVSFAYRAWNYFKAQYAELTALSLPKDATSIKRPINDPEENQQIFKKMQKDGIYLNNISAEGEAGLIRKLISQREELKRGELQNSYSGFLSEEFMKVEKAYAAYFSRLKITRENNKETPDIYLEWNYSNALDRDSLLYVRACEEIGCSLNPQGSEFCKMVIDNLKTQVVSHINKRFPNKNETLFYGGFASGLLLRDLAILKELIEAGYKKLELAFVDQGYTNLLAQVAEPATKSLAEQVAIDMQMKAISEFANWVATRVDCSSDSPLKIHFFANTTEAEAYFKKASKKMDVLVAQDYFTKAGTADVNAATPTAHNDFMSLAKIGLKDGRCFFELIKDDLEQCVYLHAGIGVANDLYLPYFTNIHDTKAEITKTYQYTSLGFFTGDKDGARDCIKGAMCTTHDHNKTKNGP